MTHPKPSLSPQQQIKHLQPYHPGMPIDELARKYKLQPKNIIKLASNENPYGPSPLAQAAAARTLPQANRYPDAHDLLQALAAYHQPSLTADNFIVGNGSNDVLDLIGRVFLGPQTEAISSQYSFLLFDLVTKLTGATSVVVSSQDYSHDLAGMSRAITDKTRVIWIANPNNPTGTFIDYVKVKSFIDSAPKHTVVVLDEAYYDYLPDRHRVATTDWLANCQNLILVRTFSKIYGLAGFRVGYGIAHTAIIELLNRVRQPFNASNASLAAATSGLSDTGHVTTSRQRNAEGLRVLTDAFDHLGVQYIPSYGNFISFKVTNPSNIYEQLLKQGIIVRKLDNYGMSDYLRVTVGKSDENKIFIKTLSGLMR